MRTPAKMFWRGSKALLTPSWRAVSGMSCMRPCAPLEDRASESKSDSTWMTARTSCVLTWCVAAAAAMWWSYSPL